MLLNLSGLDVCKQRRNNGSDLTIIMLTAFGQEIDKGLGLHIGADNYLTKPFSFMDLMARVEALLWRSKKQESSLDVVRSGDVVLVFRKFEASKRHQPVPLSP